MIRPRIVHMVVTDAFAGVERYVCETSAALSRLGYPVTVIGGAERSMRSGLPPDVTWVAAATPIAAGRALIAHGRGAVVHTHMTAAEAVASPLKRRSLALVTTRHFAERRGSSLLGRLARPVIERAIDAQIAISDYVASEIGEPSRVIRNGVATGTRHDLERGRTVLVLQRLEAEKDTTLAIRAWHRSGLADDGWRLRICGIGSQERQLRELVAQLGATASVDFIGFISDARSELARAGVLLASASAEPFGLAVVEAMAEGTPVVASRGGAHPETLGPHGVFFAAGDVQGAAAQLRATAQDPAGAAAYGNTLRERHARLFTIERHAAALDLLYREVLDR